MKKQYCKNCGFYNAQKQSCCHKDNDKCKCCYMLLTEDEIETIIVSLTLAGKDLPMYKERALELLNKLK